MDANPQRLRSTAYALTYAVALPRLQAVAREHGYALAVHGSMATDLDLIACPWTEEATDAETLIEALRSTVQGSLAPPCDWQVITLPNEKPHGRRAWVIHLNRDLGCPYLDVSVMPRLEKP